MSQRPSPGRRLFNKLSQAAIIRFRYWKKYQFSGEATRWRLIWHAWNAGKLGKLGLACLSLGAIITAVNIEARPARALYADVSLPPEIVTLSLALFALGWAFALTAASRWTAWGYFIVAAYLSWYALLIGGSLAGTPLFALPVLWMLFIGWRVARAAPGRRRLWLLAMGCGASYLTYGAFGLHRLSDDLGEVLIIIALGLIYYAALINPRMLRLFPPPDRLPRPDRVFAGTLVVAAVFFAAAVGRDQAVVSSNTLLAMRGLLGVVDLFWLWLGAGLFQGAIGLGKWITKESMSFLTPRVTRLVFPLLWLGVGVFSWIATHDLSLETAVFAHNTGLSAWVNTWNNPDYWGVYYQLYASVIALIAMSVLLVRRRWTNDRLAWLSGLWLAAYIGVVGFFANFEAFGTLTDDAAAPLTFYTGLTLIGGLLWEFATNDADWLKASRWRSYGMIAFLLIMLSLSAAMLGAGLPELVIEYTLYSFFGVIYLGLPLVVYDLVGEREGYEPLSMWRLLALFVIGALSASLVLGIDPYAGPHFFIAPISWAVVLFFGGRRLARLTSTLDGLIAGAVLALGFVTFWMSPQVLPIPFFSLWQEWQNRYMLVALHRPLLLDSQWWFTLLALGAGLLIGWAATRRWRVQVVAAIVAAIALTVIAPRLPDMTTTQTSEAGSTSEVY
jgi:hypothetical protein